VVFTFDDALAAHTRHVNELLRERNLGATAKWAEKKLPVDQMALAAGRFLVSRHVHDPHLFPAAQAAVAGYCVAL